MTPGPRVLTLSYQLFELIEHTLYQKILGP